LLPFDPFLDEEWNDEEFFKEKFGDLLDTLEARAQASWNIFGVTCKFHHDNHIEFSNLFERVVWLLH